MKAKDFDKMFDEGHEDIVDDLDLPSARRVNQEQKRINVDFPAWVVESLGREAARIGVTRQSILRCGWWSAFKQKLLTSRSIVMLLAAHISGALELNFTRHIRCFLDKFPSEVVEKLKNYGYSLGYSYTDSLTVTAKKIT